MIDVLESLKKADELKLNVFKMKEYDPNDVILPTRGSSDSAGMDLYSVSDGLVKCQSNSMIHTGIAVEIPKGFVGLIFARSGLSHKSHLRPSNCVGVIDSDYRGEIMVSLYNDDTSNDIHVAKGQRIAQMVVLPYLPVEIHEVNNISYTDRGSNGFGSTGI